MVTTQRAYLRRSFVVKLLSHISLEQNHKSTKLIQILRSDNNIGDIRLRIGIKRVTFTMLFDTFAFSVAGAWVVCDDFGDPVKTSPIVVAHAVVTKGTSLS